MRAWHDAAVLPEISLSLNLFFLKTTAGLKMVYYYILQYLGTRVHISLDNFTRLSCVHSCSIASQEQNDTLRYIHVR